MEPWSNDHITKTMYRTRESAMLAQGQGHNPLMSIFPTNTINRPIFITVAGDIAVSQPALFKLLFIKKHAPWVTFSYMYIAEFLFPPNKIGGRI